MGPTLDELRRVTCADGETVGTGWTRGANLGFPGRGCADGVTVGTGYAIWSQQGPYADGLTVGTGLAPIFLKILQQLVLPAKIAENKITNNNNIITHNITHTVHMSSQNISSQNIVYHQVDTHIGSSCHIAKCLEIREMTRVATG